MPSGATFGTMFQSARQIWVWPNREPSRHVQPCCVRFNLPGRFGFGRTPRLKHPHFVKEAVSICQADLGLAEHLGSTQCKGIADEFQSARQIWVWPNDLAGGANAFASVAVSICQADLGLAELKMIADRVAASDAVSICQADLGLAELLSSVNYANQNRTVSICQADLGLAERRLWIRWRWV